MTDRPLPYGHTTEPTRYPSPHCPGLYLTPEYVAALDARDAEAQPGADPDDIAERFRHLRRGSKTQPRGRRIA